MVIWTVPARADLRHIHDHIAKDSKYYAKKLVRGIREKTDILAEFPEAGKVVPEIGKSSIRELHTNSHRILYEIRQSTAYVLAVIHVRRDFKPEDLP